MSFYTGQSLRTKLDMTWHDEFVLGAVQALEPVNGTILLDGTPPISKGTLAKYTARLMKAGYITQVRSENDRRCYNFVLTDAGRDVLQQLKEA